LMRRCTKMGSFQRPSTIAKLLIGGRGLVVLAYWRGAYFFVRSCHFRGLALSVPEVVGPRFLRILT
jgi:hypothetical protein